MQFDLNINQNKKIGIFTDCHFGVGKDSTLRLNETKKCFKWIIDTFKQQKVDYILFCGDLFDSRFSINVQTLNYAIDCMQKLAMNFQKIFLIIGNHDTFYKNTNNTNSVNFLAKLAQNENITIIEQKPYYIQMQYKTIGLYPWGFDMENLPEHFESTDYAFGHFEVNGIEQSGSISSGAKYHYKDLAKLSPNIFSGHYHNQMTYTHDKNFVYMLGDPLQLNWGQFNRDKFIYTLDCINEDLKDFKNNVNSRFEKIYYSQIEQNKYSLDELTKLCEHNFIKFVIDTKYQFENVLKYTDKLKQLKPLSLEIEYLISLTSDIILETTDEIVKSNSKDNKTYLKEYIHKIYDQIKELDDQIKLQNLQQLVEKYYNKSLVNQSERIDQ